MAATANCHRKLTEEEEDAIREKAFAAYAAGDEEKGFRLLTQIPLEPAFAKIGKELYGIKQLQEWGANLSEAVAVFGEEWLHD